MNKILKITFKHDPIFKYIVEDFPFYEGIFFYSKDFHNMSILKAHYFLREKLSINQEIFLNSYILKCKLRLASTLGLGHLCFKINPKCELKRSINFNILDAYKLQLKLSLRLNAKDLNYYRSKVNIHMMKLVRLKTHDPYTLENRDMLSLKSMDGEKFI